MEDEKPDLLLINANYIRPPVAPLGLEYLGTSLRRMGCSVSLLDLCTSPAKPGSVRRYLNTALPGMIGITFRNLDDAYYLSGRGFLGDLTGLIREIREASDAPIVLGGTGFSLAPEAILRTTGAEFGIWGEGEDALPRLLRGLNPTSSARSQEATLMTSDFGKNVAVGESIPGLFWREGDDIRHNPPVFCPELDRLGLQGRDCIDNGFYFARGGMAGFEAKRGCDRNCIYCADPVAKGRTIRLRSPGSVADEIGELIRRGITHLHTCDSEFNHPKEHAVLVCEELVRRGFGEKLSWYAYCTPAGFDRGTAGLMKRAGCSGINFGADHTEETVLERLGRDFTRGEIEGAVASCRDEGIVTMCDLLLGGPGESRESLRRVVGAMKDIGPDRVGLSLGVRIYPGTGLAALVRSEGELERNPDVKGAVRDNPDLLEPVFYLSRELGESPVRLLRELVGGDRRFFVPSGEEEERDYNYDDNPYISRAITEEGYRGAFWDMLRRKAEGLGP